MQRLSIARNTHIGYLLFLITPIFLSCQKYLDAKSDSKLIVPSSIEDLQGILDNNIKVNQLDNSAAEGSSDNYYLTDADYQGLSAEAYRRLYIWEKDKQFVPGNNDWSNAYDNVFRANTVLDNITKIGASSINASVFDNVKGQALFLRGKSFFQVATLWALAYDETTASQDLGIPLRMTSDINEVISRSSLKASYDQILSDLREASLLLAQTQKTTMRPNQAAALGLLARTFLSMRIYDSCLYYSDLALKQNNKLYDYNSISNMNATFPLPAFDQNPEIIHNSTMQSVPLLANNRAKIDSLLYLSYNANDLRKTAFFKNNGNGTFSFKGSYERSSAIFDGIATDELYLMRAECYARKGNLDAALNDLNALLAKRWKTGTFTPLTASDASEAFNMILLERRKELLMRGLRWMDIKRLNKEGQNIVLKRVINGQIFTMPPNDPRYALAIPEDVIAISGMRQNPR